MNGELSKVENDEGRNVKPLAETPTEGKKYDFLVDGIKMELKTLKNRNINTLITKVGRAYQQLNDPKGKVLYDISETNFSEQEMKEIWDRLVGKYGEEAHSRVILIK